MTTMGIIFANIYDSSLGELTNKRTMASLPYGGRYRQIDFSLSNMTNSAIRHIGIITKYNYQSLMNHIGSGQEWDLELGEGGLEFLTPFAMGHNGSYRGKLEALGFRHEISLKISTEEYVVLADSGVLCAINLEKIVEAHAASGADVTVVVKTAFCGPCFGAGDTPANNAFSIRHSTRNFPTERVLRSRMDRFPPLHLWTPFHSCHSGE